MSTSTICLDDIAEYCEHISSRITKAPLVGYDETGVLRYITGFDIHTTEDGEEDFN